MIVLPGIECYDQIEHTQCIGISLTGAGGCPFTLILNH